LDPVTLVVAVVLVVVQHHEMLLVVLAYLVRGTLVDTGIIQIITRAGVVVVQVQLAATPIPAGRGTVSTLLVLVGTVLLRI